jgi:uncharacterized protein Usg
MAELIPQLHNRLLTTAEIFYYYPDYPTLLQTYLWQDYDEAPRFPEFQKFITFWQRELDGKLHSVRLSSAGVILPGRLNTSSFELLH